MNPFSLRTPGRRASPSFPERSRGTLPAAPGLFAAILFLFLIAVFYTLVAVLLAVGGMLLLVLAMIYGAALGDVGFAATLVGGSGFVVVLLIVLAALLLWLAARLSCTTSVMAARTSLNPFAAMAESWRLSWEEQWRVMGFLALIGLGLALVGVAGVVAAGSGVGASLENLAAFEMETGTAIFGVALSIPVAFLIAMVPAGIYRELAGAAAPAEVFA